MFARSGVRRAWTKQHQDYSRNSRAAEHATLCRRADAEQLLRPCRVARGTRESCRPSHRARRERRDQLTTVREVDRNIGRATLQSTEAGERAQWRRPGNGQLCLGQGESGIN